MPILNETCCSNPLLKNISDSFTSEMTTVNVKFQGVYQRYVDKRNLVIEVIYYD